MSDAKIVATQQPRKIKTKQIVNSQSIKLSKKAASSTLEACLVQSMVVAGTADSVAGIFIPKASGKDGGLSSGMLFEVFKDILVIQNGEVDLNTVKAQLAKLFDLVPAHLQELYNTFVSYAGLFSQLQIEANNKKLKEISAILSLVNGIMSEVNTLINQDCAVNAQQVHSVLNRIQSLQTIVSSDDLNLHHLQALTASVQDVAFTDSATPNTVNDLLTSTVNLLAMIMWMLQTILPKLFAVFNKINQSFAAFSAEAFRANIEQLSAAQEQSVNAYTAATAAASSELNGALLNASSSLIAGGTGALTTLRYDPSVVNDFNAKNNEFQQIKTYHDQLKDVFTPENMESLEQVTKDNMQQAGVQQWVDLQNQQTTKADKMQDKHTKSRIANPVSSESDVKQLAALVRDTATPDSTAVRALSKQVNAVSRPQTRQIDHSLKPSRKTGRILKKNEVRDTLYDSLNASEPRQFRGRVSNEGRLVQQASTLTGQEQIDIPILANAEMCRGDIAYIEHGNSKVYLECVSVDYGPWQEAAPRLAKFVKLERGNRGSIEDDHLREQIVTNKTSRQELFDGGMVTYSTTDIDKALDELHSGKKIAKLPDGSNLVLMEKDGKAEIRHFKQEQQSIFVGDYERNVAGVLPEIIPEELLSQVDQYCESSTLLSLNDVEADSRQFGRQFESDDGSLISFNSVGVLDTLNNGDVVSLKVNGRSVYYQVASKQFHATRGDASGATGGRFTTLMNYVTGGGATRVVCRKLEQVTDSSAISTQSAGNRTIIGARECISKFKNYQPKFSANHSPSSDSTYLFSSETEKLKTSLRQYRMIPGANSRPMNLDGLTLWEKDYDIDYSSATVVTECVALSPDATNIVSSANAAVDSVRTIGKDLGYKFDAISKEDIDKLQSKIPSQFTAQQFFTEHNVDMLVVEEGVANQGAASNTVSTTRTAYFYASKADDPTGFSSANFTADELVITLHGGSPKKYNLTDEQKAAVKKVQSAKEFANLLSTFKDKKSGNHVLETVCGLPKMNFPDREQIESVCTVPDAPDPEFGGMVVKGEVRYIKDDGSEIYVLDKNFATVGADGEGVVHVYGIKDDKAGKKIEEKRQLFIAANGQEREQFKKAHDAAKADFDQNPAKYSKAVGLLSLMSTDSEVLNRAGFTRKLTDTEVKELKQSIGHLDTAIAYWQAQPAPAAAATDQRQNNIDQLKKAKKVLEKISAGGISIIKDRQELTTLKTSEALTGIPNHGDNSLADASKDSLRQQLEKWEGEVFNSHDQGTNQYSDFRYEVRAKLLQMHDTVKRAYIEREAFSKYVDNVSGYFSTDVKGPAAMMQARNQKLQQAWQSFNQSLIGLGQGSGALATRSGQEMQATANLANNTANTTQQVASGSSKWLEDSITKLGEQLQRLLEAISQLFLEDIKIITEANSSRGG